MAADTIKYTCTVETFKPDATYRARWLDVERDYDLVRAFWPEALPRGEWHSFNDMGYTYATVIQGSGIVSLAAMWTYSDEAWEMATPTTRPDACGKGYAKSVVSFITRHILASGRLATCSTHVSNIAMQRTAESVGFQQR